MKISDAVRATSVVAILLIAPRFCSAQDKPIGDLAREAQAQKSEAHHAKKLITDDDIGPDRGAIHETDDPVTVIRDAWRAFLADAGHTCHGELTNNSGPGSVVKSLIEAQGPDRIHMVIKGPYGPAGDSEVIVISGTTDMADSVPNLGRNIRSTPPGRYLSPGLLRSFMTAASSWSVARPSRVHPPFYTRTHITRGREYQEHHRRHLDWSQRSSYP